MRNKPLVKRILVLCLVYYGFGFFNVLAWEVSLHRKYRVIISRDYSWPRAALETVADPYSYLRSAIFAPFWLIETYFEVSHEMKERNF